ncbi:peptidoglycan DD-metalloendopeptidase family protein [Paenibacillus turpanensis]|uniref:peptidoglycan DD-metalloendopeptidase family protein n=1 Tax=Paenibacillus turpanensis TaxID=2689078 RepID=UPI00140CA0C2
MLLISGVLFFRYSKWNADYAVSVLSEQHQSETTQLIEEKSQLESDLITKEQTIQELQNSVITLSETADQLQQKLEELKELETQIRSLSKMGSLTSSKTNVSVASTESASDADSTAVGGELIPATDEDMQQFMDSTAKTYEQLSTQIESVKSDLAALQADLEAKRARERRTPTIWPTDSRTLTSGFGYRRDPFTNRPSFHSGYDFDGSTGDSVYATAEGKVSEAGWASDYGYHIVINHGNGLQTQYAHLSKILVEEGQAVSKGEKIGLVGSTGRSTGPHLHYEVIKGGEKVNPKPYLIQDRKEVE